MSPPVTFLFWNIARQQRIETLRRLVNQHKIDVVVLAESNLRAAEVLARLSSDGVQFTKPFSECPAIEVYTRFSSQSLVPVLEDPRISIRELRLPERQKLLLAMAHLPGKLFRSDDGQALAATQYARLILDAEEGAKHSRTLLVGDLNMNPFDLGVVGASALHAVSTRHVASRLSRKVDGKPFRFFYNPMWGLMGDRHGTVAGTFYRASSEPDAIFWHMLDQVLIRPDLLSYFRDEDIQILTGDGEVPFLNRNGIPDRNNASDHLPILFRLYL